MRYRVQNFMFVGSQCEAIYGKLSCFEQVCIMCFPGTGVAYTGPQLM